MVGNNISTTTLLNNTETTLTQSDEPIEEVTPQLDAVDQEQSVLTNDQDLASAENKSIVASQPDAKDTPPKDTPVLDDLGFVSFNSVVIAKLVPNQPLLEPKLELIGAELNQEETAALVQEKLGEWLNGELRQNFAALYKLKLAIDFEDSAQNVVLAPEVTIGGEVIEDNEAELSETALGTPEQSDSPAETPVKYIKPAQKQLSEPAKEIAKLVFANHGSLERQNISAKIAALTPEHRRELRINGIRFGRTTIYLPLLLKPKSARLSAILGFYSDGDIENKAPYLPPFGVTSFELPDNVSPRELELIGFKNVAGRAIRLDIIDRVIDALFEAAKLAKGPFTMPANIVSFLGASNLIAENIVVSLGWEKVEGEDGAVKWKMQRVRPKPAQNDFSRNHAKKGQSNNQNHQKRDAGQARNSDGGRFNKPSARKKTDFTASKSQKVGPKAIDADNPFAVLAGLKASLEGKKDQ
jgi:hypothetical protein